jgi:hypothetical protein
MGDVTTPNQSARDRFMERLRPSRQALTALSGDALFHVQVEVICRSLDVIEQVTDQETALRIAAALAARWIADIEAAAVMERTYADLGAPPFPIRTAMLPAATGSGEVTI